MVDVEIRRHTDDVPCTALPIIGQIDEVLIVIEREGDLVAVESPRAELHDACLLIEGEICYIDCARALINRWRHPEYLTVRVYQYVALVTNFIVAVSAINKVNTIITYIIIESVNINLYD